MNFKNKLSLENVPEETMQLISEGLSTAREVGNTVSELNGYFRLIKIGIDKRRERKCRKFLEGLVARIYSGERLNSRDHNELEKLLNNDKNKELVIDILEEALNTVSDISTKLLGIVAGEILNGYRTFDYRAWILVNAIKNMNDWDIENLKKVYLYFDSHPDQDFTDARYVYLHFSPQQVKDTVDPIKSELINDEEYKMLKSSLMRMSTLQILSIGETRWDDDGVAFIRSEIGREVYDLINLIS
ncbi:hypothetical protein PDL03_21085 [Bacillus cereus]|nr:hypothetical protein [Bacillus cereus]